MFSLPASRAQPTPPHRHLSSHRRHSWKSSTWIRRIHDRYIEVRDAHSREVVATIEVLSPFNKQPGAQGYKAFQEKRIDVMASSVHWIEIDLLRAGMRPPEVAYRSDYYALLSRGDRRQPYEGWFFDLRDRMPTIAVPLRPPYADIPLDLQAVFGEVYIRGRYAYDVDYMLPAPPPPLHPDDEQWLRQCIHEWQAKSVSAVVRRLSTIAAETRFVAQSDTELLIL